MRTLAQAQEREHPATNARWSAEVSSMRRAITGANTWTVLALLSVAVALVLAVACANVANLVLARGAARQRETAMRAALGAGRLRLVRQFLTEGAILSVLGGGLGVLLAGLGLDLIRSVTFEPFFELVVIDRRVLGFSAAISLLTPLIFGLLPALQATGRDLAGSLKDAGGGAVGVSTGRARARNLLVVGQLSVALALLLVAGLSVRMALVFQQLDLGFEPGGSVDPEDGAARGAVRERRLGPRAPRSAPAAARGAAGREGGRAGRGRGRCWSRCRPRRCPSRAKRRRRRTRSPGRRERS